MRNGESGSVRQPVVDADRGRVFRGAIDDCIALHSDHLVTLQFHTLFGGDGPEEPSGLATDDVGNIYFGGNTCSSQSGAIPFPLTGSAYDSTYGGDGNGDAFIAKLNVNFAGPSASLNYSTYFGGGTLSELGCPSQCVGLQASNPTVCPGYEGDRVRSLMLMPNGRVLCCGDTDTTDFPTYPKSGPNAVRDPNFIGGDSDAFVAIHNVN
ncbi:MAG: SBBP repeat-containing protein [Planctomycetes bacterium]|nr:SBBP repeat-containing protein [Planctomycetota bacterium]